MTYRTLLVIIVCFFPLNFYAAMLSFPADQSLAEQARICAYYVARASEDDTDYQAYVTMLLHHAQSSNSNGLTILHCPVDLEFYKCDADLKVIEYALGKAVGGNDKFFEALFFQQAKNGDTPIHYAIRCGEQHWLCVLLNVALACSNVCDLALIEELFLIKNKDNETILECALRGKRYYAQQQYGPRYHDIFKMLKKFKDLLLKKSNHLY